MRPLSGLATGIGSLPYTQGEEDALGLIFKYVPQIPFWPQLPKSQRPQEGMVAQFSENLPCLRQQGKDIILDLSRQEEELETFYGKIISADLDYFQISKEFARGLYAFSQRLSVEPHLLKRANFIKCHITGPFTFAASVKDAGGKAILHNEVFLQAVIKGLAKKACWQIDFFRKFGKDIIIFVDEPYLGCFGSAYTPINRQDVVNGLAEFIAEIKSAYPKALIGIHCCGNTDWPMLIESPIDIINFDAFGFLDKFILYADSIKAFLARKGIICWGIVPTQDFTGRETPQSLLEMIQGGISKLVKKGLDADLLAKGLLISPACGLGALDDEKAEKIFALLSQTSGLLRETLCKE
ncbi:MAG: methionine synthase [Candidatus Omnitrophota bacterium]